MGKIIFTNCFCGQQERQLGVISCHQGASESGFREQKAVAALVLKHKLISFGSVLVPSGFLFSSYYQKIV